MSYIGNPPAERFTSFDYQDLTGGTGTSFTLTHPVGNAQEILVMVNNVVQEPGVAYTVSGTGLTMTGSIASTDDFYVVYRGKAIQTATHPSDRALTATDGTFTGDLTVDTNTLVVDAANNKVGIRTSPERDLHVKGASGDPVHLKLEGDPADYARIMFDDGTTDNIGELRYHFGDDNMRFRVNNSERLRIQSGGGISFNGDTAAVNALSDYEEGTFEPTFTSAAGDFTSVGYNGDTGGRYIKVGNLVYVQGCARINGTLNKSNRSSGETLVLGNLPFANSSRSNGDNADSIANVRCPVWGSGDVPDRGIMRNGSNAFSLVQHRSNATSHTITAGDLPSDAMMQFTVMYTTN
jgi:hypothetical protein